MASRTIPRSLTVVEPVARESSVHDLLESHGFRMRVLTDPPGVVEYPGSEHTVLALHVGAPVRISCKRGADRHTGIAVHGAIDLIPPNTPSVWENGGRDTALVFGFSSRLIGTVAEQLDVDARRVEIRNHFQIRDAHLEHIGWALKAELDAGFPTGRLYVDSLAVAAASRLVVGYGAPGRREVPRSPFTDRRLKRVLSFIEDNIAEDVSLADLAEVAGTSVSHFKSIFRTSIGSSAHQYVIRRRVERARALIVKGAMPLSQIALETGFAHQSHLARHMRRVLGVRPAELRER